MDSLTQIVLGAACGEAALGKKIGNKALLFGAIGGTIPDLDVYIGYLLYNNHIDAMMFHRGFMHSILFSVFGAFLFGWLTFKLYNKGEREHSTNLKDWILLYFLSLLTHPLLDAFTPYGTQLFSPFSNYRVAFNTISVVDPIYTLPFLIALIVLMFYKRNTQKRQLWLRVALGVSSLYLLFTVGNKLYVDSIFENSLKEKVVDYNRFSIQPTIFNNILWYGIAETNDNYQVALYSLLDKKPQFSDWQTLPKNHELLPVTHPDLAKLAWFSNDYFNLFSLEDGTFRYNDLRYPLLNKDDPNSSVFSLQLFKDGNRWNMEQFKAEPPKKDDLIRFWERLKGQ